MLYIDEVLKGRDEHGCEVITHVYYTYYLTQKATDLCSKRGMINHINTHPNITVKTKYKRNGVWHEGAVVRVVDNEYLRTDGNNIKSDNLGELD